MAFADTAVRNVVRGNNDIKVLLEDACEVGDLLAYGSTGYVLADASDDSLPALLVAGDKGAAGETITAFQSAVVEGPTGMTPGASIYLSDTAGDYDDSTGSVTQVVGKANTATQLFVNPAAISAEIDDIAAGTVVNADVATAAAIAFSKLAALPSTQILVGNGSNVAAAVAVTGDVTMANTGAVTIAANAVETAMIAAANVTEPKLSAVSKLKTIRTPSWDVDTDAGGASTRDEILFVPSCGIEITEVRIVYDVETSGTIAAGSIEVGTAAGGEQIVAAAGAALENSKAVGYSKVATLVEGTVAADAAIFVRLNGVAATAAGWIHVEVDYYCTEAE